MSRPAAPVDPPPDGRGRTVVWSAGSSATPVRRRTRHGPWREVGLVVASVAAVLTLAYAVQAWHVITPAPAGASVPLWLPDRPDADESGHVPVPATTRTSGPHPSTLRSSHGPDDGG